MVWSSPRGNINLSLKNYDKVHNSNPSITNAEAGRSKFETRLGRLHAVRFWGILNYKSCLKQSRLGVVAHTLMKELGDRDRWVSVYSRSII